MSTKKEANRLARKTNGLKVTFKRRACPSGKKKTFVAASKGLPVPLTASFIEVPMKEDEQLVEDDIPCDTMLAMQSIIQAQHCLFIPSQAGGGDATVPLVLESQLYQKLENPRDGDSILTKELLNLIHTNQLRRMVSTDDTLVALIHTRDYVRAVWDAHHACCNADAGGPILQSLRDITPWFLASLSKWTTPTISRVEMSHLWKSSAKHLSQAIDILVMKMGVLMATNEPNIFMFWLPNWGIVLQAINKAQKSILMRIKRSAYKEISEQSIRNLSLPGGISAFFVVQTLIAIGTIHIYEKAVGTFIRLTK